jgi:hypothetical protein
MGKKLVKMAFLTLLPLNLVFWRLGTLGERLILPSVESVWTTAFSPPAIPRMGGRRKRHNHHLAEPVMVSVSSNVPIRQARAVKVCPKTPQIINLRLLPLTACAERQDVLSFLLPQIIANPDHLLTALPTEINPCRFFYLLTAARQNQYLY